MNWTKRKGKTLHTGTETTDDDEQKMGRKEANYSSSISTVVRNSDYLFMDGNMSVIDSTEDLTEYTYPCVAVNEIV